MATTPAPRPRRRWLLAGLVASALLGAGVAVGLLVDTSDGQQKPASHATARTLDAQGRVTTPANGQTIVEAARVGTAGSLPCDPPSGFADVPASQVIIVDEAGRSIAVTSLDVGMIEQPAGGGFPRCAFTFHVDIPAGHAMYGVEVGQRGKVMFTARQVATGELDLSLG